MSTISAASVRGKFYQEYMKGSNVVLLDADVAEVFRDSEAVNHALRTLITRGERLNQDESRSRESEHN